MVKNWDTYSRQGLDLASSAANLGFSAAKFGTRCGFALTRGIVSSAVGVGSALVDHTLFGGNNVARQVFGDAAHSVISFAERVTLAPIVLGEYVTATSVIAAHSSINVLSVFFPGSNEASFSLASFINLVYREWTTAAEHGPGLSDKEYGITQIARGIIAWVSLQGVTQEWQEKMWFKHLREIRVHDPSESSLRTLSRRNSRVRVTSDVIYPDRSAHIIAADIGEAPPRTPTPGPRTSTPYPYSPTHSRQSTISGSISRKDRKKFTMTPLTSSTPSMSSISRPVSSYSSYFSFPLTPPPELAKMPTSELKATLRRLSKLVLAGYGGATLWFFGISALTRTHSSSAAAMASEEAELANAIVASEAEASGEGASTANGSEAEYSWWNLLLGKHDQELFERAHQMGHSHDRTREKAKKELREKMKSKASATAVIGSEHLMPRFWVLTDHGRGQVVLVMRGTMSLNEIAADLTCESEPFEPVSEEQIERESLIPGQFTFPPMMDSSAPTSPGTGTRYHVHAGMLRMAKLMGEKGKPVQLAVQEALYNNPDYELVMCGHSLGAGVAALLAMMWADPKTCLTVRSSGLPAGRRVSAYLIGPPALTDAALGKLANNLIVSFVYSHDIVARLSLGSVRDLRNAAAWLCEAEKKRTEGEGYSAVTSRARRWKDGFGSADDPKWFIATRKTLEASMQSSNMFPPGRVLWGVRDSDLHPNHRSGFNMEPGSGSGHLDKLRLFEVQDVEKVFGQIVFARHMLTSHFPNEYDKALHDLL